MLCTVFDPRAARWKAQTMRHLQCDQIWPYFEPTFKNNHAIGQIFIVVGKWAIIVQVIKSSGHTGRDCPIAAIFCTIYAT